MTLLRVHYSAPLHMGNLFQSHIVVPLCHWTIDEQRLPSSEKAWVEYRQAYFRYAR
jgi:hypothetical protein